jgi:Transposase Tn5 dimerisation domain/Transposase DNA-binding
MECSLVDEVAGVALGDQRLTRRLGIIAERLGAQPQLSIPAAMHGRAEMEAAYRFFANEQVEPQALLSVHAERTRVRIAEYAVCLLVQDTTEVDLTRPTEQVQGAGPMSSPSQFGAFVHPLWAVTPDGLPLGIAWHMSWVRDTIRTGMTDAPKRQQLHAIPIEDKESLRWISGLRAAAQVAEACPDTCCVAVADSEADIYELFAEPRHTSHGRPLELLIRGCQDRATLTKGEHIFQQVRATPCRGTATVSVSARTAKLPLETRQRRTDREARTATVEIRACSVTLRPPWRPDRKLPEVRVNIVLVEEVDPPEGAEPIQWLLVTTLPIATEDEIRLIVAYYCQRWQIEIFFKTLKSGCRIEERQFEFLDRELNCIALYMLVAWRIVLLCRLGRTCPDLCCEVIFEPSEWKAVYQVVKKQTPPTTPPKLNDLIRLIASLGGYVVRPKTDPGTQTLWIGLQRMHDFANCYDAFGPNSQKSSQTCVVR